MQVLLNGGKQHIFQSATRATARLNLLSPAVFPMPFGAKLLPLLPVFGQDAQDGQEAGLSQENAGKSPAGHTAGASAKVRVASPPTVAEQSKRAQHTEQTALTAKAEAPNTAVQMRLANQGSRHTKHAKHGPPALHLPDPHAKDQSDAGPSQSMLICEDGKGALKQERFRAGSKPQQAAARRGKACDSPYVVGPVAKLVGGSSGLVALLTDESEVQSQSPGR